MLNETDFTALSTAIVNQCFPEEQKFWSINKRQVVGRIFRAEGLQPAAAPEQPGDFKFLGELQAVMGVAGQAASLISAVLTIYTVLKSNAGKSDSGASATDRIKDALSNSGLAMEKATKICDLVRTWPASSG